MNKCFLFLFLIIITGLISCEEELFDFDRYKGIELEPEIALPLAYADYSMGELISKVDSVVQYDADNIGTIIFYYQDSLPGINMLDRFRIPVQDFSDTFNINISTPVFLPEGERIVSDTIPFQFQLNMENNERLDSAFINSGQIEIEAASSYACDVNIYLRLHSITQNKVALNATLPLTYQGTTPVTGQEQISLSDSRIDLTSEGRSNLISADLVFECISSGTIIQPDGYIALNMDMLILSIQSLFGYVGRQVINFNDESIELGFFDVFDKGFTNFELPRATFNISTNAGLDLAANIRTFYGIRSGTGIRYDITGKFLDSLYLIRGPTSGISDDFQHTSIKVNTNNSNLQEVFTTLPSDLIFEIVGETNPFPDSTRHNYLYENSAIFVDYRIEMPLNLTVHELHGLDTVEVDIEEFDVDEIEAVVLKIVVRNGLPIGGQLNLQFLDENDQMINNLFGDRIEVLPPAETDPSGLPLSTSQKITEIKLTNQEFTDLARADKMVYDMVFNTYNASENQLVRITEQSRVEIRIGISGSLKTEIKF